MANRSGKSRNSKSHNRKSGLILAAFIACALAAPDARGSAVPRPDGITLIDMSSSAGSISAESTPYNAGANASHAFDGNKTTRWLSSQKGGPWYFVYEFNVATKVSGYRLYNATANEYVKRAPNTWTISGSLTGEDGSWTELDSRSGETKWATGEVRTYRFANDTAYKYYKFNCTANNGDNTYLQLYEIEFGLAVNQSATLADLTTATSGSAISWSKLSSDEYTGAKAFDEDKTTANSRWLASLADSMFVVYKFNEATAVNAISVYGGSDYLGGADSSNRAPKAWTFSGSQTGEDGSWTILDAQTDETGWASDGEDRYYQFINQTPYSYYKFDCTALNGASADCLQIRELEFFHYNPGTPQIGDVSVSRTDACSYSVSATELLNAADTMAYIVSDGITVTTNVFAATVAEGETKIGAISGLTAGKTYQVSVLATNSLGANEKVAGTLYTGELTLGATTDANENDLAAGTVAVSRAADDPWDLAVNYTISSSAAGASEGTTWSAPSAVVIPAGETTGYLLVTPLLDPDVTEDITVTVTLAAGNYEIPSANSATLPIDNLVVPSGYNTWIATEDGLASVGSNWSTGIAPTSSDNVLFDGRFSTANCEWDAAATHTVATWTQTADYAGTVTFDTKYPVTGNAFQTFTVTGACVVDGGVWTHPVSVSRPNNGTALTVGQLRDAYTYRLSVAAGSFTIGSGARIDAIGKGLSQKRVSANVAQLNPAHGGKSGDSTVACYGNPKYPEDIGYASNMGTDGLGKCAAGGGAVKIAVTGACVVNGVITVDGERSSGNVAAGAAGSVLIEAASVSGTGSIFARAVWCGNNSYANGVGGRIALITVDPVDTTLLTVSAGAASDIAAASGTVYLKDASMTDGVLIVRNTGRTYSNPAQGRRTDVSSDGSWKFDRVELGGDVQFAVPFGTTLTLPGWNCVSAPYNGSGTPSGLYYLGGSLDFGSSSEVTLSGKWYFAPISNYVFHANVSLADGASIGFGGKYPQRLANNTYPVAVDRIHCTVDGNMTVPAGCSVNVNQSGAMQDSNGVPADYPQGAHGGRRSNTMKTIGSVFHPRTLPHGQSNSYGHQVPGGAVELVVTGTLSIGGSIESTGYTSTDGIVSQIGGGSIDITAGRLVGGGTITAGAVRNGQPGGRIAIHLTGVGATLDDFDGAVNCATLGAGSIGSCGSIYIETAADGDRRGTVILDDNNVTCTTYTPICATGYEADDFADFKKASLVIKQQAKGQVTAADAEGKFAMNSVEIDSTGQLDLFGHTLTVNSAKVNGVKLASGTYTAGSNVAIGDGTLADYLVDTADGAGGSLVVTGGGFSIRVR